MTKDELRENSLYKMDFSLLNLSIMNDIDI